MINPAQYLVSVATPNPADLIFSENYSSYWVAKMDNIVINSKETDDGVNRFRLNKVGEFEMKIDFLQQNYYHYGQIISGLTLFLIIIIWRRRCLKTRQS